MLNPVRFILAITALAFTAQTFCSQLSNEDIKLSKINPTDKPVFEIVKWKSKPGISDQSMIAAVEAMVIDLRGLKGFLNQSLYKNSNNEWVDVYYWQTEEDAHASNISMADKTSFSTLIELIEADSVSIEVMQQLQSSFE